jgi:hypothetical protein
MGQRYSGGARGSDPSEAAFRGGDDRDKGRGNGDYSNGCAENQQIVALHVVLPARNSVASAGSRSRSCRPSLCRGQSQPLGNADYLLAATPV